MLGSEGHGDKKTSSPGIFKFDHSLLREICRAEVVEPVKIPGQMWGRKMKTETRLAHPRRSCCRCEAEPSKVPASEEVMMRV